VIAAGLAGVQENLSPPPAVQQDPGQWADGERERAGIVPLPSTPEQREQALLASERVTAALGDELLGAFLAVRRSDAEWAADRTLEEIVTGHLWRY
jgi:glutamine synthetase